jgi:twitching motility protein PilI
VDTGDPFELLLDIERRCLNNASGLPTLDAVEDEWIGIGFRIGDDRLIASMAEIKEILDLPQFTNVPGMKSWMVGVANVRGSLLPLMDMKGYLLGETVPNRRKSKVIVIDYKGFNTGLLVEEVYGMKHFLLKDNSRDIPDVHKNIAPYVERAFYQDGESWPVFSFESMTREERLAQASL